MKTSWLATFQFTIIDAMPSMIALLRRPLAWIAASLALLVARNPAALEGAGPAPAPRLALGLVRLRPRSVLLARRWPLALELAALGAWAAWVGRNYLDFDPATWPIGGELPMSTQGHIVWSWLGQCGDCVLWNGSILGGSPALVDLHGAVAHPLVVLTSILFGAFVGAKVALVICFFLGGLAQWWLALVLGLGRFARLWSAAIAVAAGHMAGRMEIGVFGVVLSTACASLALVAGIALARGGGRRMTVLFAALLALTIMAGQGYIQIGFAMAIIPAFAVLLLDERLRPSPVWRSFAIAGGHALLLSAVFLVPLLHFWPSFAKDIDPTFDSVQPLSYVPLNFVIDDEAFLHSEALGKQPFPYLYINYIGWLPVLLAMAALRLVPRAETRLLSFFLAAIALVFVASSGLPFQLLQSVAPEAMASIRNPSLIAGLAVPLILGLAAWGLDRALGLAWPRLALLSNGSPSLTLNLALILILAALWSIAPVYSFSQRWLATTSLNPEDAATQAVLTGRGAAWVQSPYGEAFWLPGLLDAGAKIAAVTRPWTWVGREPPPPAVELTRDAAFAATQVTEGEVNGMFVVVHPDVHYAAVTGAGGVTPCAATARGGHVDVVCDLAEPGVLRVYEHHGSGWQAWVDGAPARLSGGSWLEVQAVPGRHAYRFRYRPWDVAVGLTLTVLGLAFAYWYARGPARGPRDEEQPVGEVSEPAA